MKFKKEKKQKSKQTNGHGVNAVKTKADIVVAISGGFDPLHVGHIKLIKAARKLGDSLVVILNNDNWLSAKKSFIFMKQEDRKEILEAMSDVDKVILSFHDDPPQDMSVCSELEVLKPDIFANGGDRLSSKVPERGICNELGIEMKSNVGGRKMRSSSEITNGGNK